MNKDRVSEKYLKSTKQDMEKLNFYKESLVLIKNMKINEAIDLLEKCNESDFNTINVNNYLAICYVKKGDYNTPYQFLDKIFKIDVKNPMAKDTRKILDDMNLVKKKSNIKKVGYIVTIFIFVIVIFSGIYLSLKSGYVKLPHNTMDINENVSKSRSNDTGAKDKKLKSQDNIFDYNTVKSYIDNKNYNGIYNEIQRFKNTHISINDKLLLVKARNLLSSDGMEYFYKTGCNYLNNKDYKNADKYFLMAFEYGSNSYLYPNIIYMLANTMELSGDVESSIKYYNIYDSTYPTGSYEPTVIYRLALIYKDLGNKKAKVYAEKLINTYPSSIYNNTIINSIVNN